MSKNKSWFARVKDFLFPMKDDKKEQMKNKRRKKKKWTRTTEKPPSLEDPSLSSERTETNAKTQVAHQALSSTTTTTTTRGIILPTSSSSMSQNEEYSAAKILLHHTQLVQHVEHLAAIKIQTAYRAYLARKALRALRGLVRLQAMIRGRAVRRQAVATLKSLQSIVNIQSQVCATRYQKANENKSNEDPRDVKLKIERSSQRRRDHTLLMTDEKNAIQLSKTEAMMRRNRFKAYSFNHRHSADTEDGRMIGRLRRWLEEHEEDGVPMKEDIKRVDTIRLRNGQEKPTLAPRSSRRRATSHSGDKLDVKPTYMAATESARARARKLESYSDGDSPYKSKLSPMSSMNSERNFGGGGLVASGSYSRQRSCTGFKGIGGSMRFNRNVTDSGMENGRWLLNWN